ncbi:MAG TPA: HupE/UreJ family protein [Longimicrobiales bacterium]|nr:HupE/UreJ family protein [Longimicrobiales bacterium]
MVRTHLCGRRLVPRLSLTLLAAAVSLAAGARVASAHEIPESVTVHAFAKPDGNVFRLVLRVPLESMRDLSFPLDTDGYLGFDGLDPLLQTAARMWIADYTRVYADGQDLGGPRVVAARVALPGDGAFTRYEDAVARATAAPLPSDTRLHWRHAMLDVLLEYDVAAAGSRFDIEPSWAHLGIRTTTVLRFLPPGGTERVLHYNGDPGLLRLDPRWYQSAAMFTRLGFSHILEGIDHLLFLLCLVIPFRRVRSLIVIVTSFTIAHSITLAAAALGFAPTALWFPPLIEVLIALSIVWMAFENIVGPKLERRWLVAFGFGLVHGFGFSFLLSESLQFAGGHLAMSLLAFNVGVEIGQVAVLLLAVPLLNLLFRHVVRERVGSILLSALVAHTAWHWMSDRFADLREYSFTTPALDMLFLAAAMRWLMLLLVVAGVLWLMYGLANRWTAAPHMDRQVEHG